jgi:hypothetical protein
VQLAQRGQRVALLVLVLVPALGQAQDHQML